MAKHIDNINRTGVQKKGSTAKSMVGGCGR